MKNYFIFVLITVCISLNISAQTAPEKKPSTQWWMGSALADSVIDHFRFHVEGQYSYTKTTGMNEGEVQSGGGKSIIRNSIFTNHTEYMIEKTNMTSNVFGVISSYLTNSQVFTDYLDVDVTKLIYFEGGYIWERDNAYELENRNSIYLGAGLNGLIYDKHYLKLLLAYGDVNQDYMIPVDNYNLVKGAHTVFYIRQNYKLVMSPVLSFSEDSYYLTNTQQTERYRMGYGLNLSIMIIQPVSLYIGYNYRYDSEIEMVGLIGKNTVQTLGVNISL
jgi:hypothetical protein